MNRALASLLGCIKELSMHKNHSQRPPSGRRKNTAPGESHHHLMGAVDLVEVFDDKLIVTGGGHRRSFGLEATFCEVQATFWTDFRVWLSAGCRPGETHYEWWDHLKSDGQRQNVTCSVDVTFFGRTAEVAQKYLSQGSQVGVSGTLQLDEQQNRSTGRNRQKLKVIGESLHLIVSGQNGQRQQSNADVYCAAPERGGAK